MALCNMLLVALNVLFSFCKPFQATEHQLKSGGSFPRALLREHANVILLPLDNDESELLRSLINASKQFQHFLGMSAQFCAYLFQIFINVLNGQPFSNHLAATNVSGFSETLSFARKSSRLE